MTVKDFLLDARNRIQDHHHFCRGPVAMDSQGRSVGALWPKATRWCSYGTMHRTYREHYQDMTTPYFVADIEYRLDDAARRLFNKGYIAASDDLGHNAAMKIFDLAIQECNE